MKHMFKGNVQHGEKGSPPTKYVKGDLCPDSIVDKMNKLGVIEVVPEPVKPTQPALKAKE